MIPPAMTLNNFWLTRCDEKEILQIVEWAQKARKKPTDLTQKEINEAIKTPIRGAKHELP